MSRSQAVLDGIATVARTHLDWQGPVEPGMSLVEDLELDSLRLFTLAAEVENHFRVRLDEGDEMELQTVGDLVDLVSRKLLTKGSGGFKGAREDG